MNKKDAKFVYVTNDDPNDKGVWGVTMERYKKSRKDKEQPVWYVINHEQACEITGCDPDSIKNFDHNLEFAPINPKGPSMDEEDVMILGGKVEEEEEDELDPNMYSKKKTTTRKKKPVVQKSALD